MKYSIKGLLLCTLFVAMALTIGLLIRDLRSTRTQFHELSDEVKSDPKRLFYAERVRELATKDLARLDRQWRQVVEINEDYSAEVERLKIEHAQLTAERQKLLEQVASQDKLRLADEERLAKFAMQRDDSLQLIRELTRDNSDLRVQLGEVRRLREQARNNRPALDDQQ